MVYLGSQISRHCKSRLKSQWLPPNVIEGDLNVSNAILGDLNGMGDVMPSAITLYLPNQIEMQRTTTSLKLCADDTHKYNANHFGVHGSDNQAACWFFSNNPQNSLATLIIGPKILSVSLEGTKSSS